MSKTFFELAVDTYTDQEVIQLATNLAQATYTILRSAVSDQNLGNAGEAKQASYQALQLLEAYNEKLNGKKEPTVVQ